MKTAYIFILLFFSVFANAQIYTQISFEQADSNVVIDSSKSWQIAIPGKDVPHVFFDSAYVGSMAIMTDSSQYYSTNLKSEFSISFQIYGYGYVSFKHKINSTRGKDGGYMRLEFLEIPTSDSLWLDLKDTSIFYPNIGGYGIDVSNSYRSEDTLYNGANGFSGDKSQWEQVNINFLCNAVKNSLPFNNYRLHFYFISDSISDVKEGWIIDDINIINGNTICSGLTEVSTSEDIMQIYPNPSSTFTILKFVNEPSSGDVLRIVNQLGQIVRSISMDDNNDTIHLDVDDLKTGLYKILWYREAKVISHKTLSIVK